MARTVADAEILLDALLSSKVRVNLITSLVGKAGCTYQIGGIDPPV
ncbi:MAG: hypothetical protein U5L01_14040 [Rheinheimera sp.]|nr:hypothetical protein [Rheinheimera sp.]